MSEIDPNEFTEREKFILSYYRSRQISGSSRIVGYDLMFAIAAIGCVVLAILREETGFWFIGFMLLLGRLYYLVTEGGRWTKDFQSIFAKYDAKLKAATDAKKTERRDDVV
jgi:hypothetical protein